MTRKEAQMLCDLLPATLFTNRDGSCDSSLACSLKQAFPVHDWRVALVRKGRWTRWALRVGEDPAEVQP